MSFIFTDISFTDEFTGAGGGGVPYINGGVLSKHIATIQGYFYLAYLNKTLTFNAATKTITNADVLDLTSFLDDGNLIRKGLQPDRTIEIEGSASNDGTYTIDTISEDGRTITTVEALINEVSVSGVSIFDDTPVTALDFYYNLIPLTSQESYLSLTDRQAIQRFIADGLAANVTTPVNMLVGSSSFGWVTNTITNTTTGETSEVTVEGADWVFHQQKFKIIQQFSIAPFATAAQIQNFQNISAPDYFRDGNALKYICRIDGKFSFTDPEIPHTGASTDMRGLTNWFNENNIRTRAEYYLDSVVYADGMTGDPLTSLDIEKSVDITITIKSRTGQFTVDASEMVLDFLYIPLNESRYIGTPDTTLRQNLLNDRKFLLIAANGNGEFYGTDYQVLTNITFTYVGVNTVEIDFSVSFASALKTFLKTLPISNRNFVFSVTTQDSDITTTIQNDRVPVLCPINQIEWDKSDPSIIESVDTARIYHFPQINYSPRNSVSGWEGDTVYVQFPFRVKEDYADIPKIMEAGFQVVVTKAGEEDFILEEKIFDTSLVRKFEGAQTIDIEERKNFIDLPYEYNVSSLKRDSSFDDIVSGSGNESMLGFLAHHAFVLRYDYWNKIIQDAERFRFSIFKDIETPTEAWNTLQQNGWVLQIRFVCEINHGADEANFTETFDQYWDIDCKAVGDPPDGSPIFESTVEYIDYETGIVTSGISKGGKTIIKRTYIGDTSNIPAGYNSFFGYIFADYEGGGITTKRFASTEFDSEDDSPFTAYRDTGRADKTWASANLRISIFESGNPDGEKIELITIYDDVKSEWSFRTENILFYPKLGFMTGCFMLWEQGSGSDEVDGYYILSETGQRLLWESCESES